MDSIDVAILACLKENSRMNASDISDRVNMSVSAVIERIRKMENVGIVKQYTIVLDSKAIGKDLSAFISVSLEHPKYNESFAQSMIDNPNVLECHYITGDFDYILRVLTSDTTALEQILNEIKNIKGVSLTRTIVVFSTVKDELTVLPEATK